MRSPTGDLGNVDILIPDADGLPLTFYNLVRRATARVIVVVASHDEIITSKEFANRAKDQAVLSEPCALWDRVILARRSEYNDHLDDVLKPRGAEPRTPALGPLMFVQLDQSIHLPCARSGGQD